MLYDVIVRQLAQPELRPATPPTPLGGLVYVIMQIADTTDVGFPNKERQKDVGLLWLILLKKSQKTATCHALSGTAVDLQVLLWILGNSPLKLPT